jgi:4,5-DOPA dioxygenase extradiol
MQRNNSRVLFLSHGGGPLPLLGDAGHSEMVENLRFIAAQRLGKPSAIIVISAHWEEAQPTITSGAAPPLIYDYFGFPDESYHIKYPCPGEPRLAEELQKSLQEAGIEASLDNKRGFDHGLFVPLKIMYPEADVPCVQLSLVQSLSPTEHINIGAALAQIQWENLLVVGSGFSFHNMQAFFAPETEESKHRNEAFEQWLIETCSSTEIDEKERAMRLLNWEQAPFARYCHPREEHLLPLHVCYGVAQRACTEYFALSILNKKASIYVW